MSSRTGLLSVLLLIGVCSTAAIAMPKFWGVDPAINIAEMAAGTYDPFHDFNVFVNDLFIPTNVSSYVYEKLGPHGGYYAMSYLRDLLTGSCIYWGFAGLWHLTIYVIFKKQLFTSKKREFPKMSWILDAMFTAQTAVFVYAALPVFSQFIIANNLTRSYFFVDEVGGIVNCAAWFVVYFALVEIGIYWMHRTLHTNKFLYKHIHGPHHKYRTVDSLTPWASIAFHPIDGILQAAPYVVLLCFIPVHYITHVMMLFASGVWATNIHDATWFNSEPFMGSKYHTLHHTHYHYNYGQYLVVCDYIWGTLRPPEYGLLYPEHAKVLEEQKGKKSE